MKTQISWKKVLWCVILCLGIGGAASWLTIDGLRAFQTLSKPSLTPPKWAFPVVWSILLILNGIGFGRIVSLKETEIVLHERAISAFSIQITFFFCWMIWFFGLGWYGFAALWTIGLIGSIVYMIFAYRPIDILAARLQIPYLLWSIFALYLNIGVWMLNR